MLSFKNLKLLVLDNDDVLFKSSPLIQFHVERNWPQFGSEKLKIRERNISIIQYQHAQIEAEIKRAREAGEIPNLPNFNVTRNDVIRVEDQRSADFEDEYYIRPLFEIGESLELVKEDKEMFLEERDTVVEADGKLDRATGKIPYDEIYRECNWFPYTRENVQELYRIFGERLISLTAHNGLDDMHGREFEAKQEALRLMCPEIKHYGLRFHKTEHVDKRRPRNSKSEKIQEIYGLDDMRGVVVADDSPDNCRDVLEHGGTPIFVNPNNRPNPYGFAMVKSTKPESIFRELERTGYTSDSNEVLQKPKTFIKTR